MLTETVAKLEEDTHFIQTPHAHTAHTHTQTHTHVCARTAEAEGT